ncbi:hypothetical protein [Aquaspirillum soli]
MLFQRKTKHQAKKVSENKKNRRDVDGDFFLSEKNKKARIKQASLFWGG